MKAISSLLVLILLLSTPLLAQAQRSSLISDLRAAITDKKYERIDGMLVKQGEQLVVEAYFNGFTADSLHDMRSSFKSVTSLLAGIAIDQGLFSLNDRLGKFFPELQEEGKKNIRVKDLLEMRSGLNCEEFYGLGPNCEDMMEQQEDWVDYALGIELNRQPGLNWSYTSIDAMLVGEIITRASRMKVMDFTEQYLFKPLGISNYRWTSSPKGQGMTGGSFYARPRDMMKLITLVKNQGTWHGRQVVSAAWIEQSTACELPIDYSFVRYSKFPDAKYHPARYGYYWYRERLKYGDIDTDVVFASGNGGQYMMMLPAYDLTVVFTGSNYGNWRGKLPFEFLLKYIIPGIANHASQDEFSATVGKHE